MVSFVHLPLVLRDLPGLNEGLRQALNTANPRTSLQLGTAERSMFFVETPHKLMSAFVLGGALVHEKDED
ncbi:hypothetical protein A2U01_0018215, partial [Trifolium medium]|nr:hypothetical protein [Trifolium medium]